MDQSIAARLSKIEARLSVLEATTGVDVRAEPVARAPVVPPPPPPPALSSPTPGLSASVREPAPLERPRRRPAPLSTSPLVPVHTSHAAVAETKARDLERFFGVAVLGRIGVAAVLLAAAYFAQLAYRGMSDVLKVLSIYGLSAAFVGVGWFVRTRAADKYVALLWGGAAASAYLAGVAAYLRYDLVGPWVALGLLAGASALGQFLAHRLKHEWLASTALAGAFGAPLLVAPTLDNGTFLVAYLLMLHAWSAFTEARFGWVRARFVGVFGTLAVGGLWLASWGAVDTSTYVIVNAYLVGLVAPEILALIRGHNVVNERRALLLGLIAIGEGGLWAATVGAPTALPAFGWIAGAGWIAAGLGLRGPATRAGGADVARGLVTIGGLLVTIGCLFAPEVVGAEGAAAQWWMCSTLVLSSLGMLWLRRIGGVGDLAAAVAAILAACAAPGGSDPATSLILAPLCALPALALVFTGRSAASRAVGVGAGLVSITAGTIRGAALHDTWLAVALAGGAAWTALTLWVGTGRRQIGLLATSAGGLALVASLWFAFAFIGPLKAVQPPLVSPATLAGMALVLVAGWAVLNRSERLPGAVALPLWTVALAVALGAGHREVVAAVQDLALPVRDTAHVAFLAAAGAAIAWLGARRRVVGVEGAGVAVVLTACLKLLHDGDRIGVSGWVLPEVALAAAGVVAAAYFVRNHRLAGVVANVGVPALALSWVLFALEDRFPGDAVLLNARFAAGLVVLGAAALVHWLRPEKTKAWPALLAVGGALGYLVGLAEVLDGAEGLTGAWGDVLVSVYTTLYAAGLLVVGFMRRDRRLRYPALVGFGIVILKVGLHDLSGASLPLRIFVTGVLGLVLLAAAYGYARRSGGETLGDVPEGSTPPIDPDGPGAPADQPSSAGSGLISSDTSI